MVAADNASGSAAPANPGTSSPASNASIKVGRKEAEAGTENKRGRGIAMGNDRRSRPAAQDAAASLQPVENSAASVPVPTFVSPCSTLVYERRNQRDTSNSMILVRLWI